MGESDGSSDQLVTLYQPLPDWALHKSLSASMVNHHVFSSAHTELEEDVSGQWNQRRPLHTYYMLNQYQRNSLVECYKTSSTTCSTEKTSKSVPTKACTIPPHMKKEKYFKSDVLLIGGEKGRSCNFINAKGTKSTILIPFHLLTETMKLYCINYYNIARRRLRECRAFAEEDGW